MEWIKYHEAEKVFDLRTENSTYQMQVREYDTLVHLYYGCPVGDSLITDRIVCVDRGFSGNPYEAGKDKTFSLDTLPQEYTAYGNGDYRINGLTVLEECHYMYHGEKVAFGTLAQLVLENVLHEELEEIIMWCIEVGLPVTLEELGAGNVTDEQLMEVAKAASAEGDTLQNMPFTVTPESVFAAIKAADAYGRYYLGEE